MPLATLMVGSGPPVDGRLELCAIGGFMDVQYALTWAQAMGAYNRGNYKWAIYLFLSIEAHGMADWVKSKEKANDHTDLLVAPAA